MNTLRLPSGPAAAIALLGSAATMVASDLPRLIVPEGVGVNIHFNRGHEQDLDLIAAAGIKFVRMDLGWAGIERTKGAYDWSACDELTAHLAKRGLRAIYILDYSNPLYEESVVTRNPVSGEEHRDTASPQHPESVAAFAHWAAAAAARYREQRVIWEIWNEPNITFWKPKPEVSQYNTLALETCRAIRAVEPKATIIGPATSEIPLSFFEQHFACGVLEYLDAVSVHPYRNYAKPPETAAAEYAKLRELIAKHAPPPKRDLPILSGEWGYASHTKGVSLDSQAAFAARQQLVNLLHGLPLSIWYDWKNDGPDPAEREHNFGLVTAQLEPKPAYRAIRALTTALDGYRLDRRLPVGGDEDYVLLFSRRGQPMQLAVWTTGVAHSVPIPVKRWSKVTVRGVNLDGPAVAMEHKSSGGGAVSLTATTSSGQTLQFDATKLTVDLNQHPLYLTLEGVRLDL